MFQSLKQLNHLRLYQNTQQLNTSSFLRFVQSVFQILPVAIGVVLHMYYKYQAFQK